MKQIDWDTFPNQSLVGGLRRYVEARVEPGSFLRAVLENDLTEASFRADDGNKLILAEIAGWCYHYLPHVCRGSDEAVQEWLDGEEPSTREDCFRCGSAITEGTGFVLTVVGEGKWYCDSCKGLVHP